MSRENWRLEFYSAKLQKAYYKSQMILEGMPAPSWLKKVKGEIKKSLPSTLAEGTTSFKASTMSEPKMSGKFRKYAFTCETVDGRTINLSVSPTLLNRILEVVESNHDFSITKQGTGINTDYTVSAV